MNKIFKIIIICLFVCSICSCSCKKDESNIIEYTHYARGGVVEELDATVLWEHSTDAYTKYQVAYTSYVCSNISVNYINVIYIEITNKETKDKAVIRDISFTTKKESNGDIFNVGLWGDDKSQGGNDFYTGIEEEILSKLRYMNYESIKSLADTGYKNYTNIEGIDVDAMTGGTISASNVISIVKAIFDYHIDNQY